MAMFDKHKSGKPNTPAPQDPPISQTKPAVSAGAPPAATVKVAMIGQGISISGDIKADNSLKIEGKVEGRGVQCTQEVEIAESGHVTASITANVVKVSGVVSGDISGGEKVFISKTGRVQGNIVAPRVQLEDGALFRGSIDMTPAEPAAAEKPAAVRKTAPVAPAKEKKAATGTPSKEPGLNLKSG
jgi:cytoskeletal protein CcmA (bactofilin family)